MVQLLDRIALVVAVLGLGVVAGCVGRMLDAPDDGDVEVDAIEVIEATAEIEAGSIEMSDAGAEPADTTLASAP